MNRILLLAACVTMSVACAGPATTPDVGAPHAAETPAKAAVDRNCLRYTGTRVRLEEGRCAIGPGTVLTRDDIDSTGRTDVGDAIEMLVPSTALRRPRVAGANR